MVGGAPRRGGGNVLPPSLDPLFFVRPFSARFSDGRTNAQHRVGAWRYTDKTPPLTPPLCFSQIPRQPFVLFIRFGNNPFPGFCPDGQPVIELVPSQRVTTHSYGIFLPLFLFSPCPPVLLAN